MEQELKFQEFSMDDSSYNYAIYRRGYVYYASDYILYRVVSGGEKDDAEIVWQPEKIDTGEVSVVCRLKYGTLSTCGWPKCCISP